MRKHALIFATAIAFLWGCDAKSPEGEDGESADLLAADVAPLVTNNLDCSDTSVFRFDAVSPDGSDNRRIFIDFANARWGVVGRGSIATDSHFGGGVTDCSTDEVRCVDAGQLAVAWPKDEARTTFPLGKAQCQLAQAGEVSNVNCFVGRELTYRYRVTGKAIDRVELFYPDYPNAVFEAVDDPLPLCKL